MITSLDKVGDWGHRGPQNFIDFVPLKQSLHLLLKVLLVLLVIPAVEVFDSLLPRPISPSLTVYRVISC